MERFEIPPMHIAFLPAGPVSRVALLLAVGAALGMSACGRRGQPEPPPGATLSSGTAPSTAAPVSRARPSASGANLPSSTALATRPAAATLNSVDDDVDDDEDPGQAVSPSPNPGMLGRRRGRTYSVPKEPFFLDPLL